MRYQIGQEVHNKNFHAIITDIIRIKGEHPKYEFTCLNCKQEKLLKDSYSAEKGIGCPVCANRICVKGINDIATTDPWMIPYFVDINDTYTHTANMNEDCVVKCPDCGRIRSEPLSPNQIYCKKGFSCVCKDGISIPNKLAYAVMEQLKQQSQIIEFDREYMISDKDSNYYFDIYFLTNTYEKYFLEMDGGIGHGRESSGVKSQDPVESLRTDRYKEFLAENEGFRVIRIDMLEYDDDYIINQFTNSKLSEVVYLQYIDWNKVFEIAFGNIIKDVCEYKKKNPDAFTTDATKIFKLDRTTISKYWKMGNRLGWCEYNPSGERVRHQKSRVEHRKTDSPILVVAPDGKREVFDTWTETVRKSEDIFGKKFARNALYRYGKDKDKFMYGDFEITKLRDRIKRMNK